MLRIHGAVHGFEEGEGGRAKEHPIHQNRPLRDARPEAYSISVSEMPELTTKLEIRHLCCKYRAPVLSSTASSE